MKRIFIEVIDYELRTAEPDWWKRLMGVFLKPGTPFEIRCWREESGLICQAQSYGTVSEEGSTEYEVSVTGVLTPEIICALLDAEPPQEAEQLTRFFTISGGHISSAHYGRQIVISDASEEELRRVRDILSPITEYFSYLEEDL